MQLNNVLCNFCMHIMWLSVHKYCYESLWCIRYGEESEDVVSGLALGSGCSVCGWIWSQSSVLGERSLQRPHHWREHLGEFYNRPCTHDCLAAKFFQLNLQVSSLIQIKINILLINRETNITIMTANCRIRDLNKPQPWMRTQFMWLAEKRCAVKWSD